MREESYLSLSEDELDVLVSIAIRRAQLLDDTNDPAASAAWREVMVYEEKLAAITSAREIPGGVARVGAIAAALAGGQRREAQRLAAIYRADGALPTERRLAIDSVFQQDLERRARRYPALARSGRLAELDQWRADARARPLVFPRVA